MHPITHAEALELCPALVPDSFSRRRPGHRILRLQRAPAARGPPAARRGRRRGHHHRRQGPLGPAPRLRLGTRRRAGRLPGRRRGQRRRRLGRRARRPQRRREARLQPYRRTAAIVDVEHPLPEACPMVAAADDSFYFRPRRRPGPDLARRSTCRAGPRTRSRTRATSKGSSPGSTRSPRSGSAASARPGRGCGRRRPTASRWWGSTPRPPDSSGSPARAGTDSRPPPASPNWPPG